MDNEVITEDAAVEVVVEDDATGGEKVKLYTPQEVAKIVAHAKSTVKDEAVNAKVEKITAALTGELEVARREVQALRLSVEHGLKADLLLSSGLSGDALGAFTKMILEEKKAAAAAATLAMKASITATNDNNSDWKAVVARQLAGE